MLTFAPIIDSQPTAEEHPLIKDFVTLVDETVNDGPLDFKQIRSSLFMKYWSHLIIYEYEKDIDDFRVRFCGTDIAEMYSEDYTGDVLSNMGFDRADEEFFDLNKMVLDGERRVFANGTLFWKNKEHKQWCQVKMPLQRNGTVNEVLICMDMF